MPSISAPHRKAWDSTRTSRHQRGYGRDHDLMRAVVLREEPLCRICEDMTPPRITPSVIADHKVPKAEGGGDERENYQGLCRPCHDAKTAKEAARAQGRPAPRPKARIGPDGWPEG